MLCLYSPHFVYGFLRISGRGWLLWGCVNQLDSAIVDFDRLHSSVSGSPVATGSQLLVMFFPLWMVGVARVTELLCTWSSSYSLLVRVLLFLCATVCLIVLVVDTLRSWSRGRRGIRGKSIVQSMEVHCSVSWRSALPVV